LRSRTISAASVLSLCACLLAPTLLIGCNDGCVRNSDCPMTHICSDAICVAKRQTDAATNDDDAGR
jgi:hypothetical protein